MKHLKNTLFLIVLIASFGTINAQSDLLAVNTVPAPTNIAAVYTAQEKIKISEFMPDASANTNSSMVSVKCLVPVTMKVKVFNMNGEMAKEESRSLNVGLNEFNVDMSDLSKGMYMVQFYSTEGSAVRRFMKID
jgi:hypothetical protein